jgi:hypothetical protein
MQVFLPRVKNLEISDENALCYSSFLKAFLKDFTTAGEAPDPL